MTYMALQDTGSAPYAPAHAVTSALEAYRSNGLIPNNTNLLKLGIPESIIQRTVQSLKMLDLLNEDGTPAQALTDFKQAPSDQYLATLAETLRAAYAPVFAVTGPNLSDKTPEQIEDAFRLYTPDSLRSRMVTLFLGLCQYVGMIEEAPARKPGPKTGRQTNQRQSRPTNPRGSAKDTSNGTPPPPPPPPPADPNRQTGTTTLEFRSGGSLTLTYAVDLFALSTDDRDFLLGLIDKVKSYPAQRQLPAVGQTTESSVAP